MFLGPLHQNNRAGLSNNVVVINSYMCLNLNLGVLSLLEDNSIIPYSRDAGNIRSLESPSPAFWGAEG